MRLGIIIGIVVLLLLVGGAAFVLLKPNPNAGDAAKLDVPVTSAQQQAADAATVSAEQLRSATCEQGQACYVAVNGVVYDLAGLDGWKDGEHHGITAGSDATTAFVDSPHAAGKLADLPVVGRLG